MIQVSTFSVIVRTKDRPTLLARCLASIAAQQRLPDTVIIVNDGGITAGAGFNVAILSFKAPILL